MIIHKSIHEIAEITNPILTVGTFDGVHIGHQKIISRINEIAKEKGGESVLLTFHPHPRKVLFPDDDSLKLINTIEEKTALLEQFGLGHVIYMAFEKSLSRMSPVEYVRDILVNKIGINTIVIGYDHHFGRNREGDIDLLRELSVVYDFEVVEISAQEIDEITVSSTKVRRAIENGEIRVANDFLGHPFSLTGTVVEGAKIGREIGYPTANIQVSDPNKIVPGNGVYEVHVQAEGDNFTGMLNIGNKPTIEEGAQTTIEVHLLDFNSNLYGQELTLTFIRKIRDEQKFKDLAALRNQLSKDEESVRRR